MPIINTAVLKARATFAAKIQEEIDNFTKTRAKVMVKRDEGVVAAENAAKTLLESLNAMDEEMKEMKGSSSAVKAAIKAAIKELDTCKGIFKLRGPSAIDKKLDDALAKVKLLCKDTKIQAAKNLDDSRHAFKAKARDLVELNRDFATASDLRGLHEALHSELTRIEQVAKDLLEELVEAPYLGRVD